MSIRSEQGEEGRSPRRVAARLFVAVLLLAALAVAVAICPLFRRPGPFWKRRVVREHPLEAPIPVISVSQGRLELDDGRVCELAGITLPGDPGRMEEADGLIRIAAGQGVEIVRRLSRSKYILRCEPRVWHGCGNDPVAAHYERFLLNELLVASGYARFDPAASGLTAEERARLRACQEMADAGSGDRFSFDDSGIRMGAVAWLNAFPDAIAASILAEESAIRER